jgi:hypothetical protein
LRLIPRPSRLVTLLIVAVGACVPPPPAGPGAGALGLALSWSAESCRSAVRDRDGDGLDDDCELALAAAFAPELVVDPRDCLWDSHFGRLGGGYLFAVDLARDDRRALGIAYLPAYYRDCGWAGPVCMTRGPGCAAHDGDSELVVVEARYDPTARRWVTEGVFLSAHCFGRSDGRCKWYRGADLRRFVWVNDQARGAPRVWVARGKHGNYPSSAECDAGHWYYDSCDGNSTRYRFPVVSATQNIGSRRRPLPEPYAALPAGCIAGSRLPLPGRGFDAGTAECFWDSAAPFRGWQRTRVGTAPTPYARVLEHAAEF